jgi:hypothetical protein
LETVDGIVTDYSIDRGFVNVLPTKRWQYICVPVIHQYVVSWRSVDDVYCAHYSDVSSTLSHVCMLVEFRQVWSAGSGNGDGVEGLCVIE